MTPYGVILKELKQLLEDGYDQLFISNTLDLNQQGQIMRMNVFSEDFFKSSINLTLQLKESVSYPIRTFLLNHCKIMVIKYTADTKELGKSILILDDQCYATAMEKLSKIFDSLQKINQLPTMKSSLKKYNMYQEISRENQISDTLRTKAAQIKSRLVAQPKTIVPK